MTDMSSMVNSQEYQKQLKMIELSVMLRRDQDCSRQQQQRNIIVCVIFMAQVSSIILVIDKNYSDANRSEKGFWSLQMWLISLNSFMLSSGLKAIVRACARLKFVYEALVIRYTSHVWH